MSFVAIFSASFCHGEEVAAAVAAELGVEVTSSRVLAEAGARHGVGPERLERAMHGPPSFLDTFRKDRFRNVAYVREALADELVGPGAVYQGFGVHLLPRTVSHVLKVALVASRTYRIEQAMRVGGLSERRARRAVEEEDAQRIEWTRYVLDASPNDERLYDEVVPMHLGSVDDAVRSIVDHARRSIVQPNPQSMGAVEDFRLAARVGVALAEAGHEVEVSAVGGAVTLTLERYVIRLEHLENELKRLALEVPGVERVETRLGARFRPPSLHRDLDVAVPPRVLLVDDEKEFVHTLSERLEARELGATVAYDGEDALSLVEVEEPEVMVLDLRMPGIDGIEVLRRVKRDHPSVEVIVLTGHGSDREEQLAHELGAFAYLHKPVDIELLARTMREAYQRAAAGRRRGAPES